MRGGGQHEPNKKTLEFASPPGRDLPEPSIREALDEPHLTAEDLEREIGDSEAWDEASEDKR